MSKISVLSHFQETDVLTSFWYVETTDTIEFHISRCFETFVELSVLSKQWYGETTVLPRARGRSFPKRTYSADWVLIVFRNQRCKRVLTICPSLRMSPSHCVCILHLLGSKQLHLNLSLVILMSFLNHGRKNLQFSIDLE